MRGFLICGIATILAISTFCSCARAQQASAALSPVPASPSPQTTSQEQAAVTPGPATSAVAQLNTAQAQALGGPVTQVASAPQSHNPAATQQPATLGPPFQLSDIEQQFVDQILQMWEDASDNINTFDCEFERWEYDPVFGPGNELPMIKSTGQLTYSQPDKGSFKINQIWRYEQKKADEPGDYILQEHEVGEHWVCDGKAIYEYKHDKKQLVVQPLPPQMRGKSIVDGPLPFLFGAEADKLKARYWIRSKQGNPGEIWLEAYPRTQADAANYHHVEVILERKTMRPKAIQVHMPNAQNRSVYMFQKPTVNGKLNQLLGALFQAPRTPLGWTKVVEQLPGDPQAAQPRESQHR